MMSVREIVWNVSKDAMTVTPNVPQRGGVQGEHNAVKVVFTIPEGCVLLGDGLKLYISCTDATGQYDKTEPLTVKDGRVEYPLPRAWTQYGGTDVLELTAEKDDQIIHSVKARVVFESRPTTKKGEKRLLEGFMQAACDAAEGSAERAQENAETSVAAANAAARAAATATSAETAAEQYVERVAELAQDVAGDLAETNQHREAAEAAATTARQYAEDAGADAVDANASATAAKQYAEAASGHDTAANQHRSAAEAAATRADSDSKSAESAATNAAASASNAANSAEASRRYSQSAQEYATSAATSAAEAAAAAENLTVDNELDTTSNNPVANAAVAGGVKKLDRRKLDKMETEDYAFAVCDEDGNITFAVDNDGKVVFVADNADMEAELQKLRKAMGGKLDKLETDEYVYAVCDEDGNVAFAITNDGEVLPKQESGGTTVVTGGTAFDLYKCGLPVLALAGDTSAMTKDNAVDLTYTIKSPKGTEIASGTCSCKWQGSSSVRKGYPKRNYTIKFDTAIEATRAISSKDGVTAPTPWGEQKKYCFKANWIDPSAARNVVCAKLWGSIVDSRANSSVVSAVTDLRATAPNKGAIDGFPCIIVINGEFEGLYTFNIPKDGWMFGMGDGTAEYVVCGESNSMSACGFYAESTFVDGGTQNDTDFAFEYQPDGVDDATVVASFNNAIRAVMNAPNSAEWESAAAPYFDIDSAIDYYIFVCCISGVDNLRKNILYGTYDGVKWFISAYDLDSTMGSNVYGNCLHPVKTERTQFYEAANGSTRHRLFELIYKYSKDKLKARYAELRSTVLSDENVWYVFNNFVSNIPRAVYNLDAEKWADKLDVQKWAMPSTTTANVENYIHYYRMHTALLDKEMEE